MATLSWDPPLGEHAPLGQEDFTAQASGMGKGNTYYGLAPLPF